MGVGGVDVAYEQKRANGRRNSPLALRGQQSSISVIQPIQYAPGATNTIAGLHTRVSSPNWWLALGTGNTGPFDTQQQQQRMPPRRSADSKLPTDGAYPHALRLQIANRRPRFHTKHPFWSSSWTLVHEG